MLPASGRVCQGLPPSLQGTLENRWGVIGVGPEGFQHCTFHTLLRILGVCEWKVSFQGTCGTKLLSWGRMLKLLHSCIHLTHYQSDAQNSPRQASVVCELWTSRCSSWIWKRQRNQRSNYEHLLDHQKSRRVPEKHLFLLYWLCQSLWLCGSR